MRTGPLISGAAHAALIAAAIWGLPWLTPREREPIEVTSVSFVTDADFEAAQAAASDPAPAGEPAEAVVLPPETAEAPEMPAVEPEPAPPEAETETAMITPQFEPEAPLRAPDRSLEAVSPARVTPAPPTTVMAPRARPAIRIEPEATPPAPEETREAALPQPETAPQPDAPAEVPEQPAEAPLEAAPEPVAEPAPPVELALESAGRPMSRPRQQRTVQLAARAPEPEAPRPDVEPAPEPEPEPEEEPERQEAPPAASENLQSQLSDLVASASQTEAAAPAPAAASGTGASTGPPLSAGEKDGLRLAVQECWNVPAGLRDAQELRVVLAADLTATGDVVGSSIRLIDPDPVPDTRFQRAFDAGRRALIRCAPYNTLPRDKYAQWRSIEVVFNPEGMVSW
jgi:hypothetical protein